MNHALATRDLIGASSLWLMDDDEYRHMMARLEKATPTAIEAAHTEALAYSDRAPTLAMVGDVAVINAAGPIMYRRSWLSMYFGSATIEDMQLQLQMAVADPAVRTVAFRWHSGGGSVEMVPEFADALYAARGQKPIVSIADTCIASAAYWLASQTDAIYVTQSSRVGAVGTYLHHQEMSAMFEQIGITNTLIAHGARKVDGNQYEPLSEQARAAFQVYVDEVGVEFEAAVARGRGVSRKDVADTFGQGDVIRGKKAIALGMADKQGTFAQVLSKLTRGRVAASTVVAEAPEPEPIRASKTEEAVAPVDGVCADGYTLGDDNMCHLTTDDAAARDEAAIIAALI
jgi:ClpP class serine protease